MDDLLSPMSNNFAPPSTVGMPHAASYQMRKKAEPQPNAKAAAAHAGPLKQQAHSRPERRGLFGSAPPSVSPPSHPPVPSNQSDAGKSFEAAAVFAGQEWFGPCTVTFPAAAGTGVEAGRGAGKAQLELKTRGNDYSMAREVVSVPWGEVLGWWLNDEGPLCVALTVSSGGEFSRRFRDSFNSTVDRLVVILEQQQGGTEKEVAASALRACLASRGSAGASRQAAAVVVDSDETEVVAAVSRLPEHRRASACAALHMDIEMLHSKRRSSRYNPPPPPAHARDPTHTPFVRKFLTVSISIFP